MSHVRKFMRDEVMETASAIGLLIDAGTVDEEASVPSVATPLPRRRSRPVPVCSVPVASKSTVRKPSSSLDASLVASHIHTFKSMQRQRKCALCAVFYHERNNVGQWRCRYHTGLLAQSAGNVHVKRYLCCNRPNGSAGCVACDHTEDSSTYAGPTPLLLVPRFFLQASETVARAPIAASVLAVPNIAEALECPMWTHVDFRDADDIIPPEENPGPKGDKETRMRKLILSDSPVLVLRANHFRLPLNQ